MSFLLFYAAFRQITQQNADASQTERSAMNTTVKTESTEPKEATKSKSSDKLKYDFNSLGRQRWSYGSGAEIELPVVHVSKTQDVSSSKLAKRKK